MIEITNQTVREGLKALVDQAGEDFVYSMKGADENTDGRCVYVYEGKPDCIVGQFLANMGVPVERLAKADTNCGIPADVLMLELGLEGVITFRDDSSYALTIAQRHQDMGKPWGLSLYEALKVMD